MRRNSWQLFLSMLILYSCASNLKIVSSQQKGKVIFSEKYDPNIDLSFYEKGGGVLNRKDDKLGDMVGSMERISFFSGLLGVEQIRSADYLSPDRSDEVYLKNFSIITTFTLEDLVFGLFPFTSRRTVIFHGNIMSDSEIEELEDQ